MRVIANVRLDSGVIFPLGVWDGDSWSLYNADGWVTLCDRTDIVSFTRVQVVSDKAVVLPVDDDEAVERLARAVHAECCDVDDPETRWHDEPSGPDYMQARTIFEALQ